MEQLSLNAVRQLRAKVRNGISPEESSGSEPVLRLPAAREPRADSKADSARSWINPAVSSRPGGGERNPADLWLSGGVSPAATDPTAVERRLVRRAEVLWARLAGDQPLPPAFLADELLRPPFRSQALVLEMPINAPARISFVGETLSRLTNLSPGADSDAEIATRLGTRLVALARRAATLREAVHYDSDKERAQAAADGEDTQLLMRAIALPLSGVCGYRPEGETPGTTAVVIASWRKLLSAEETRALHRELAAAIDWMHRQGG